MKGVLYRGLQNSLKRCLSLFQNSPRVLIIGAGDAGKSLIVDLKRSYSHSYRLIALVDDDETKIGQKIQGIPVVGTCKDLAHLIEKLNIQLIIIALPSATSNALQRIIRFCENTTVALRILPSLKDLVDGRVSANLLREVALEDLFSAEKIDFPCDSISNMVHNKKVLVTGGGGSIGAALCAQLAFFSPAELIVIDNNEYNLYLIDLQLQNNFPRLKLRTVLCSITDRPEIKNVFAKYKPDLIFHAAAYKHVPLLEGQPRVAIYNNVIGTRIVAEEASLANCEKFILISTDKAVNPFSVMGATKRAAEILCQYLNHQSNTHFITVRFGNVLESSGSVVPLFRKQLKEEGVLTITHPAMTRYFIPIREVCQLILQAACMDKAGDIFILDMGEPVKISFLAELLIRLAGKTLNKDVKIRYTGLRPGEKIHEELSYKDEEINPTLHPKIRQAKTPASSHHNIRDVLEELDEAYKVDDEPRLLGLLCQLVPEYKLSTVPVSQVRHLKLLDNEIICKIF